VVVPATYRLAAITNKDRVCGYSPA